MFFGIATALFRAMAPCPAGERIGRSGSHLRHVSEIAAPVAPERTLPAQAGCAPPSSALNVTTNASRQAGRAGSSARISVTPWKMR